MHSTTLQARAIKSSGLFAGFGSKFHDCGNCQVVNTCYGCEGMNRDGINAQSLIGPNQQFSAIKKVASQSSHLSNPDRRSPSALALTQILVRKPAVASRARVFPPEKPIMLRFSNAHRRRRLLSKRPQRFARPRPGLISPRGGDQNSPPLCLATGLGFRSQWHENQEGGLCGKSPYQCEIMVCRQILTS
jgi:hypothetical protein